MNDSKYSFSDCRNIRNLYDLSCMTKYNKFSMFYYRLIEFRKIVPQTKETNNVKKKKKCIKMLQIYVIHCYPCILKNTVVLKMKKKKR